MQYDTKHSMNTKTEIRKATLSDLDGLLPLFLDYLQFYTVPINTEKCKKFLFDRLENKDSTILIAVIEGTSIIGFSQLYSSFSSLHQVSTWILNDLFVEEKARGQKVGEALLQKAQEISFNSGAKGLSLQTSVKNKLAQMLYEKNGWIRDNEFITYYFNH